MLDEENRSNRNMIRFACCLSPFVLGKNEETGTIIFAEQCACGLDEDGFNEIVAVVSQAEADDIANIPSAFVVQWGERGIEYQRIGRIH
jgi:hypothetical protein